MIPFSESRINVQADQFKAFLLDSCPFQLFSITSRSLNFALIATAACNATVQIHLRASSNCYSSSAECER
jgi:hypothetical protein